MNKQNLETVIEKALKLWSEDTRHRGVLIHNQLTDSLAYHGMGCPSAIAADVQAGIAASGVKDMARLDVLASKLAEYLAGKGYDADPSDEGNYGQDLVL